MDITIRYIKKSETGKLVAFNRRNYRTGHILTDTTYLDWQFGTVGAPRGAYSILGAFDGEKLLGVLGLTFLDCRVFGKKTSCAFIANLMVDRRHRVLGLGYALLARAKALRPVSIDHGLNDDAARLFSAMGWRGEDLSRYAYVINGARIASQLGGKRVPAGKASIVRKEAGTLLELHEYDARLQALFRRVAQKYPITVLRSRRYLLWRYFRHPLIRYAVFAAASEGKLRSFAVVRLEGPKSFRVGRIIDFISEDGVEEFTLAAVTEYCRRAGALYVDFYFSGTKHVPSLRRRGFRSCAVGSYSLLPSRLNPVEVSGRNNINFFVAVQKGAPRAVTNPHSWYTTKGGGDQDRAY